MSARLIDDNNKGIDLKVILNRPIFIPGSGRSRIVNLLIQLIEKVIHVSALSDLPFLSSLLN